MKEGQRYKLFYDTYNYVILDVTYVESNIAFLCNQERNCFYKYNIKKEKALQIQ